MIHTRRRFLMAAGGAAAAVLDGTRRRTTATRTRSSRRRDMLRPGDPDALIPVVSDAWYAQGVSREPLNGWVHCTAGGER
ncbi:hypothetical protein JQK87_09785 [Streptomyces sp. G44]|uniref:hypothetical protein n=1 Tax=Streptomyces sp. G44 TaxID=2807632 RepID=UPI001960DD8B|nr:hypothetical protein [Streptomyces sp. G44]MBM7168695.1 hypothetical protein [Streptomyces sp. G44]